MFQALKVGFYRRFYRFSAQRAWGAGKVHDEPGGLEVATEAGPIRGHLYSGQSDERPLLVYFHGGGWVIGDLQTHHAYCQALSAATGCTVIAIDYRLAPEHPFPAAQTDCLAATQAIAKQLADFGPNNGRLLLAGDSAGGNLALCTALAANDDLRGQLAGIIATYPVVDHYTQTYPSYRERAKGQALTAKLMQWFWDSYLAGTSIEDAAAAGAFPIRAKNLADLPPTLLCTAGLDPLRDEGIAMVGELQTAGVAVEYEHYPESEHGFACSLGPTQDFQAWLKRCSDWIVTRS